MPIFDILNPAQYQTARQFYGMSGGNPLNTLLRMGGLGYGSRILDQIAFGNSLEPERQDLMRYAMSLASPGGDQAAIDAFRNQAMAGAHRQNRLLQLQSKASGFAGALPDAASSEAARAVNSFARSLASPESQMARAGAGLGLIDEAQGGKGLSLLSSLASQLEGIVGRQQARHQRGGGFLPGLLQSAAQLYGMGAFGRRVPNWASSIGSNLGAFF